MRRGGRWVALGVLALATACAGPVGLRHRVERGENLYRISKAYGTSVEQIAKANGIADATRIEVGQELVIPGAARQVPVGIITPESAREDRPLSAELPRGGGFSWPVGKRECNLTSNFGPRESTHHDGIDLRCPEGTPVHASQAGRVLYADQLRGYGNLVILEHGDGYATVYAHNRENAARVGEMVRKGEVIAYVGGTGRATAPQLHFEVRKENVARNPLFYLPAGPR